MLGDLQLAFRHVGRLFGIERIGDAARYENVELKPPLALLLLALQTLLHSQLSQSNEDQPSRFESVESQLFFMILTGFHWNHLNMVTFFQSFCWVSNVIDLNDCQVI